MVARYMTRGLLVLAARIMRAGGARLWVLAEWTAMSTSPEHALQGVGAPEEGADGLLNLVRRLSYEKPARPRKRARSSGCGLSDAEKQVLPPPAFLAGPSTLRGCCHALLQLSWSPYWILAALCRSVEQP